MKKVLSVILAVALVVCFATGALSVSAEEVNLLAGEIGPNDANQAQTSVENGLLTINVLQALDKEDDLVSEAGAYIPASATVTTEQDKIVMLSIKSDVSFRVTVQVKKPDGSAGWPSAGSDWFPQFGLDKAAEGNWIPAGEYQVALGTRGYIKYNELPSSEIVAVIIGSKDIGTIYVNDLRIVDTAELENEDYKYAAPAAALTPFPSGDSDTQAPTTTTKAADGSNVGGGSAQTGDESNVVLFSVVAALAVAVVTVSAVASKKAKSK